MVMNKKLIELLKNNKYKQYLPYVGGIFVLGILIVWVNSFDKSSLIEEIILSEVINKDTATLSIVYSEKIYSGDIYFDYELSNDLTEICTDYNCFLFVELLSKDNDSYSSIGPVIDVTNSHFTGTGTTVVPTILIQDDNRPEDFRLRLDVLYGDQEYSIYSLESTR